MLAVVCDDIVVAVAVAGGRCVCSVEIEGEFDGDRIVVGCRLYLRMMEDLVWCLCMIIVVGIDRCLVVVVN